MTRKEQTEARRHTNYWKYPEEGFPQRINYVTIAGGYVSDIQLYDIVFDKKDLRMRKFIP